MHFPVRPLVRSGREEKQAVRYLLRHGERDRGVGLQKEYCPQSVPFAIFSPGEMLEKGQVYQE